MAFHGTYTLEYDEKGNLIAQTYKHYDNDTTTENYTYNDDNTINTLSISTSNPDNIENGKIFQYTYEKDEKDRVVKMTTVNITRDNYTMVYTYEYDENDNIITETQTTENSTYTIKYEYDRSNRKIKKSSYKGDNTYPSSTTTYTYSIIGIKNK